MTKCSVDACEREAKTRGYCSIHYSRWKRHGDPLAGPVERGLPMKFFLEALQSDTNECIAWPYAKRGLGRGAIQWEGKTHKVHRVMCEQAHGAPPTTEHHAAHECGNGHLGCINPRHLAWKTPKENEADKARHGTKRNHIPPRMLSEAQVAAIKLLRSTTTIRELARMFNCSFGTIYNSLKR